MLDSDLTFLPHTRHIASKLKSVAEKMRRIMVGEWGLSTSYEVNLSWTRGRPTNILSSDLGPSSGDLMCRVRCCPVSVYSSYRLLEPTERYRVRKELAVTYRDVSLAAGPPTSVDKRGVELSIKESLLDVWQGR